MNNNRLPEPDSLRYPDWSRFLTAIWKHGMSQGNGIEKEFKMRSFRAGEAIADSMLRKNESQYIRPSSFLSCNRQTWFMREGHKPEPMPPNIGLTFAMGHALHELSYAAVASALPDGFKASFEVEVKLPNWWIEAVPEGASKGHVDCIIEVVDEKKANKFLALNGYHKILIDFKSMGGFSAREHKKKDFATSADAFGYLRQLAVYSEVVKPDLVIMAGINRDQLAADLMPRKVDKSLLNRERELIKTGLTCDTDPGKEFLDRWDKKAHFYCGLSGRKGYCPFADRCVATHCD